MTSARGRRFAVSMPPVVGVGPVKVQHGPAVLLDGVARGQSEREPSQDAPEAKDAASPARDQECVVAIPGAGCEAQEAAAFNTRVAATARGELDPRAGAA